MRIGIEWRRVQKHPDAPPEAAPWLRRLEERGTGRIRSKQRTTGPQGPIKRKVHKAMKIRMNEMTPEGKILNRGEVVIGETALEIVQAMMRDNPYMNDLTEMAYMGLTLARIGEGEHTLPDDPFAAAEAFLRVLRDRGLTTEIEDDLLAPITSVNVRLIGEDGNAFAILGRCRAAMRKAGYPQAFIDAFVNEATEGNYDDLLATVMRYVVVE